MPISGGWGADKGSTAYDLRGKGDHRPLLHIKGSFTPLDIGLCDCLRSGYVVLISLVVLPVFVVKQDVGTNNTAAWDRLGWGLMITGSICSSEQGQTVKVSDCLYTAALGGTRRGRPCHRQAQGLRAKVK